MTDGPHQQRRSAAITGAGGSLSRRIALGLATTGYRVFSTALTAQEISYLEQASGGTG